MRYNFKIEAGDAAGNWSSTGPAVSVTTQGSPVFNPIESQTIDEGKELKFTVSATDPNGDKVDLSATGLPEGALFDTATGLFTWTPGVDKAGGMKLPLRHRMEAWLQKRLLKFP